MLTPRVPMLVSFRPDGDGAVGQVRVGPPGHALDAGNGVAGRRCGGQAERGTALAGDKYQGWRPPDGRHAHRVQRPGPGRWHRVPPLRLLPAQAELAGRARVRAAIDRSPLALLIYTHRAPNLPSAPLSGCAVTCQPLATLSHTRPTRFLDLGVGCAARWHADPGSTCQCTSHLKIWARPASPSSRPRREPLFQRQYKPTRQPSHS